MEKQFTAVEWFNQELIDRQNGNGDSRSRDEIFEEAKQLEHAQHQLLKMQMNQLSKMPEYDLDELASGYSEGKDSAEVFKRAHEADFKAGFQKALELLTIKKKNMSPTERAQNLISKFGIEVSVKVVDEIMDALSLYDESTEQYLKDELGLEYFSAELQNMDGDFRYWDKVKYYLKKSEELWAVAVQVGKTRPNL